MPKIHSETEQIDGNRTEALKAAQAQELREEAWRWLTGPGNSAPSGLKLVASVLATSGFGDSEK